LTTFVSMKKILSALLIAIPLVHFAQTTSWSLIWSDEFSGSELNLNNWTHEIGAGGWGNNELQYYTDSPSNSFVESGNLHIKGIEENIEQSNYTSARLISKGKFDFQFGKIEARMKLPLGQGLWPAFWMLGANINEVSWPECGEIDIMEHINNESTTYGTIHWNNNGVNSIGDQIGTTPDDYHIYGMIWDTQSIKMYVDGIMYFEHDISSNAMSAFQEPFFIILNLAIGGNWPGNPSANTIFPAEVLVDYLRVYQQIPQSVNNDSGIPSDKVYPVPFSDALNLNLPFACDIEVADILGGIIYKEKCRATDKINTALWPKGVYFIKIQSNNRLPKIIRVIKD
jgi:beta-glucanase (GH16 family)